MIVGAPLFLPVFMRGPWSSVFPCKKFLTHICDFIRPSILSGVKLSQNLVPLTLVNHGNCSRKLRVPESCYSRYLYRKINLWRHHSLYLKYLKPQVRIRGLALTILEVVSETVYWFSVYHKYHYPTVLDYLNTQKIKVKCLLLLVGFFAAKAKHLAWRNVKTL